MALPDPTSVRQKVISTIEAFQESEDTKCVLNMIPNYRRDYVATLVRELGKKSGSPLGVKYDRTRSQMHVFKKSAPDTMEE